ncbi:MAG: imidazolonepropionase [Bacteroidetes bacterium HGW-Bacteroidetes-21]|jgi:imidazolonepropionase|nr:MAG: imidazolonepropionase [Bacteroidetes bacterium HGW-Bacteroidetes-21]
MNFLIINIKELVQVEDKPHAWVAGSQMSKVKTIKDAFLYVEGGRIIDFGPMKKLGEKGDRYQIMCKSIIDASGRMVFPCFCDSHTHLVYAGSREKEFVDKIKGLTYEEIAQRGGGILNSAKLMNLTSEDDLYEQSAERLKEIIRMGTGAVEIKSGYGLDTDNELKMLRVIKRLKENFDIRIMATFLGAHSIPMEFRENPDEYVDIIINEMIPLVAAEELADFVDVFCDKGFFTPDQTARILMAGMKHGLRGKIHANELAPSGGIQTGISYNALSVDHIEYTGDEEIAALLESDTMPTVLPGAAFFLNMPLAPVRKMIEAGLPVAMASDYNPGSSPSGNMKLIMSMACINYKMLPEEALNAVTINSAYAMGLSDYYGSICPGKFANIFITKPIPTVDFFSYSFGSDLIDTVYLNGKEQKF